MHPEQERFVLSAKSWSSKTSAGGPKGGLSVNWSIINLGYG